MKKELQIFFTALMFFTRIPVPKSTGFSLENLNKSVRYFPLAGGIIGCIGAAVFVVFEYILPQNIALLLSMASTVFITGAFHEDGFADFCDGFGGGYTKEKILQIMKDSRIGTYGSVGLIFVLALKFGSLETFDPSRIPLLIIAGHVYSRFNPVLMMFASTYVRDDEGAKAKPVGDSVSIASLLMAAMFSLLGVLLLPVETLPFILVVSLLVYFLLSRYVNRKVGGYTGDVLGALQQLTEVLFYLSILGAEKLLQ